ncbi:MAG: hypothetical protein V1722_02870 [Candidatus Micrarchaeota archaeon]
MTTDALHSSKTSYDAVGLGTSERLENIAKGMSSSFCSDETSLKLQTWASKFAVLMEYYKLAHILRYKNITFEEDMEKHMFLVDDKIINALLFLGTALAVISNTWLALPLGIIWVIYFASDKFIKTIEKL